MHKPVLRCRRADMCRCQGGGTVTSYASTPAVPAVFLSPPLIVRLLAPVPIHEACDLAMDVARRSHAASTMAVQLWIHLQYRGPHPMLPTYGNGEPNVYVPATRYASSTAPRPSVVTAQLGLRPRHSTRRETSQFPVIPLSVTSYTSSPDRFLQPFSLAVA